jgi:hypothetical protein
MWAVSQPYGPAWPVAGIGLPFFISIDEKKCTESEKDELSCILSYIYCVVMPYALGSW